VTAGGTREPIDAVRFLGNRSSGKQGHAIAADLVGRGALVTLVTASDLPVPPGVVAEHVETAAEMEAAVGRHAPTAGLVVMNAAVADFRPKAPVAGKLKKADGVPEVILEQTPDILAGLGTHRQPGQILVGFAAEAVDGDREQLQAFAEGKLAAKGADLIVANDVSAPGAGFAYDTNAVLIVAADGTVVDVPLRGKDQVASAVIDTALAYGVRRKITESVTPHLEEYR
jgi:phosphopantothenoylcysteine decarboxylase / phosphopantothenate---cysteine ligase